MMAAMKYHNPVLLFESIDGLDIKPDGIYADVTFGGGGHSKEILNRLGKKGGASGPEGHVGLLMSTLTSGNQARAEALCG